MSLSFTTAWQHSKKGYLNRPAQRKYDKHLHTAIQKFQENFPELKADGIVGPETFDYLLM